MLKFSTRKEVMKKKIILFLLAVVFVFTLLIGLLRIFFSDTSRDSQPEKITGQKIEQEEKITEQEEQEEKIHFANLEYIYYVNEENRADFEKQAANFVRKNYKNVQWINTLTKFNDDISKDSGIAEFYLQLDDADHSLVLVTYDKENKVFSFTEYKEKMKHIEDYGGISQDKKVIQDDEEEYSEIGTEPINFGKPNITDQDYSLESVADEDELAEQLLTFLIAEGEERRNFYVTSVESTGPNHYKAVLEFSTKRIDGKNITIIYQNGIYTFSLE